MINRGLSFPGWWALLPVAGTWLLIAAGAGAWINRVILSHPLVVRVGLISFPLYLWHWPLLSFARILETSASGIALRLFVVLASFVLASATYVFVEKPLRFGKRQRNLKTWLLVLCLAAIGLAGAICYRDRGLPSRAGASPVLDERAMEAARDRYWKTGQRQIHNFERGNPRVIVFGDSQAFDIFAALRNDPHIGLRLFYSTYQCEAFDVARPGQEAMADVCRNAFDALLSSSEIRKADVLIYAHLLYTEQDHADWYERAAQRIRAVNPRIRIVLFGNKPVLGNRSMSINAIVRGHSSLAGMNDFLNHLAINPDRGSAQGRQLAAASGAEFVDVERIFCAGGCPFYINGTFSYFDQDHWTEAGAKLFYERLRSDPFYERLVRPSR